MRNCAALMLLIVGTALLPGIGFAAETAATDSTKVTTAKTGQTTEVAIFAEGCFWGTQYMFQKAKGVVSSRVGYTGGAKTFPTYQQVCTGTTGHLEALEVVYDPKVTSYENMAKLFFESHDPTQTNGQGPDIGEQYKSAIFYMNDQQKEIAEKLIKQLEAKGLKVATKVLPASQFWPAEEYHQNYYSKKGGEPYCHSFTKRF
ncbi:MAG: peptide-methionine (S)-S-oxide reductase MsrA [Candidatus Sumerlaeaceae bacterium]|nr:peptide-methionine (S)-S-oxide reductase MsrA [Candidatus Sumerlaeaceae bacterium]